VVAANVPPRSIPISATRRPNLELKIRSSVVPGLRSSAMRDYRAYILGVEGHRFIKAKEFSSDYPDDATALEAAKQLLDGHEVELWDCGRLVARLSPNGEIASPELAPFSVSVAPAHGEKQSGKPQESVSLSRVSERANAAPEGNHLLLGW
jgi:hypothetical protein